MIAFEHLRHVNTVPPREARERYRATSGVAPGFTLLPRACGVTLQAAVMASGVPFAIIHAPEHMFITAYHA